MSTISRYWRLYRQFVKFSISRSMEFRFNFFFRIIMDIVYYTVNIAFFRIIYNHTDMIGGWNERQTMLFVSIYLTIDALFMTIFSNNSWIFPSMINKGDLDYHLLRPVSPFFMVGFRDFAVNSLINVLIVLGILIWAIGLNPEVKTIAHLLAMVVLIGLGFAIYTMVCFMFMFPVFWTGSGRGLGDLFHQFTRFMERPDRVFTGAVRLLMTTIIPFSLVASFPARLILEPFNPAILLHLVLVTGGILVLFRYLWSKGLKAYGSASS